MNPANLPCLSAVRPAVCVLANNHVLDFGSGGLGDTLENLTGAGLQPAGAGRDRTEAWQPAIVPLGEGRRVLVCSFGMASSGIPTHWAATDQRPGVAFVGALSDAAADEIAARLQERTHFVPADRLRGPGDRGGAGHRPARRGLPWRRRAWGRC